MSVNRFKILFVAQLPPPIHGSASISDIYANSALLHSVFEMVIVPLHYAKGMNDLGLISVKKVFKMFLVAFQLIKTIRIFKPVAVYFTITLFGAGFYRDLVLVTIFKCFKVKIIYHLHMKGIYEESQKRMKGMMYRYAFKNAYVITLSKLLTHDISLVYKMKPYIVNNGLKPVADIKGDSFVTSSTPHLLFLSNLMEAKGVFLFLQAMQILKARKYNFYAHIAGSPGDISLSMIQEFIDKNNLNDTIILEGPIYGQEKYELLKRMDIFIHPTLNDAFPLVILEAMQFQLPVISTKEGAIPEIIDDCVTGFLVPKNDLDSIIQKIEFLLMNEVIRVEMGLAGRKKFLERFTSEQMEQNMNHVLLKILNQDQIEH